MSRTHYPECLRSDPKFGPVRTICICDRLRACEQRVLDERAWKIAPAIEQYAAGVQAAREAVADRWQEQCNGLKRPENCAHCHAYADALAAIDALRGPEHPPKERGYLSGHIDGYADALDRARDAVAALSFDSLSRDQGPVATQRQALAAIDALRR